MNSRNDNDSLIDCNNQLYYIMEFYRGICIMLNSYFKF